MSKVTRYRDNMRNDYDTEDDHSSYNSQYGHGGSFRTIRRYHVRSGQAEKSPDDRHGLRRDAVPRSEYIDADQPYSYDDSDLWNNARGREREQSRLRTVVHEHVRETNERRPRGRTLSQTRQAKVKIKKYVEESRDEPYVHEKYQVERNFQNERRASTPPSILKPPMDDQYQLVRDETREKLIGRDFEFKYGSKDDNDRHDSYQRDAQKCNSSVVYPATPRQRIPNRAPYPDSDSEYSNDEYTIHTKVIERRKSKSPSSDHKRHLVQGALAGAGLTAFLTNQQEKNGEKQEHASRKVAGGTILGAAGAEVLKRARSQHRHDKENRQRSTSKRSHHKLTKALGIAVAGLAATAAAQSIQSHKANHEELSRGRSRAPSRTRSNESYYIEDDISVRSRSKVRDFRHKSSATATTGIATAAVTGLVQHARKKSQNRSRSRFKAGAEIASAGLAGAVVASLLEQRKAMEKKEQKIEFAKRRENNVRSKTRTRSRSSCSSSGINSEYEMVQYGAEPVYANSSLSRQHAYDGYEAGRNQSYPHRRRDSSAHSRRRIRSRSPSQMRHIAGAVAGATIAALGISQFAKRKETDTETISDKERRNVQQRSRSRPRQ